MTEALYDRYSETGAPGLGRIASATRQDLDPRDEDQIRAVLGLQFDDDAMKGDSLAKVFVQVDLSVLTAQVVPHPVPLEQAVSSLSSDEATVCLDPSSCDGGIGLSVLTSVQR